MEAARFGISQDGQEEGVGLFDPTNTTRVKTAFKVAKPYRSKKLSDETLAKLRQQVTIARGVQKNLNNGAPGSQDSIASLG